MYGRKSIHENISYNVRRVPVPSNLIICELNLCELIFVIVSEKPVRAKAVYILGFVALTLYSYLITRFTTCPFNHLIWRIIKDNHG